MKYRKLRIAFSALCGVLCVLLIALWIQSYYTNIFLYKRLATYDLSLQTNRGEMGFWKTSLVVSQSMSLDTTWGIGQRPFMAGVVAHLKSDDEPVPELFGFRFESLPGFASVLYVPFWAILVPVAVAGAAPWIKWRIGWRSAISAGCILATVILIAFWMRSYKWTDISDRKSSINICSTDGQLFFGEAFMVFGTESLNSHPSIPDGHLGICSLRRDEFDLAPLHGGIAVPYWLVVLLSVPIAGVPWLRFRFGLRTMLIATAQKFQGDARAAQNPRWRVLRSWTLPAETRKMQSLIRCLALANPPTNAPPHRRSG